MRLPEEAFKFIVRNSNLFALDLIIRNHHGEILLGLRNNPPAQGFWFVPGGRVYKNETVNAAFKRILKQETMIEFDQIKNCIFKGLYDHIYPDNVFGDPSFNTHYIIAACDVTLIESTPVQADGQHNNFKFEKPDNILKDPMVHIFTKNYFKLSPDNIFFMNSPG